MSIHDSYALALRDKHMYPTIAYGCAGTGKTYGAVGFAVEWLGRGNKQKVLCVRPNESFAKGNGFLPGDEKDKLAPWVRPFRQNFSSHGFDKGKQEVAEKRGSIEYLMLEHIQGLTFDNTLMIVDECQNMSFEQLKGFLTRTGKYSKVVLCGDIAQVSPYFRKSGLAELLKMVDHLELPVHTFEFMEQDIMRSDQCAQWIKAFNRWEAMGNG